MWNYNLHRVILFAFLLLLISPSIIYSESNSEKSAELSEPELRYGLYKYLGII